MVSFYALVARLRHISRWSLMRNTQPENVLEHSYMVAMLAHALSLVRRDVLGLPADPDRAAVCALFHDVTEIFTGDMPTPVKYFDEDIRAAYRRVETASWRRLSELQPEALQKAYAPYMEYADTGESPDEEVWAIVHAADTLAAHLKCVEETRAGNQEFQQALRQTKDKLLSQNRPEVTWFLSHCADSFGLTLDELGAR